MAANVFVGMTRGMSALMGALAVVATLVVLLMSGASIANAQAVNEGPGSCAFCKVFRAAVCAVLRSIPVNESPTGFDPLGSLRERCAVRE